MCQCIDNVYVCDTQACKKERQVIITKDETITTISNEDKKDVIIKDIVTLPVTTINTATPPIRCDPYK